MKAKVLLIFLAVFLLSSISGQMATCSDTNEIDVSDIPCVGFTVPINCSANITALNTTDASINFSIPTAGVIGSIFNFTFNLTEGGYELIDCSNNTATVIVGKFQQGYGINMFLILLPAIILSFLSLFISARLFKGYREEEEGELEQREIQGDNGESFIPRSRLIPIVFMLFSFVPLIFAIGFVENHLTAYLPNANITAFFGMFYILLSTVFFGTFLVSFIVWLSYWIEKRNVLRGLDNAFD